MMTWGNGLICSGDFLIFSFRIDISRPTGSQYAVHSKYIFSFRIDLCDGGCSLGTRNDVFLQNDFFVPHRYFSPYGLAI